MPANDIGRVAGQPAMRVPPARARRPAVDLTHDLSVAPADENAAAWRSARPRQRGVSLGLRALFAKLRPQKADARQRMRDDMLAKGLDETIADSVDRLRLSGGWRFWPKPRGYGIAQIGKAANTRTRTTVQRLALHRDRNVKAAAFARAAAQIGELEREMQALYPDGPPSSAPRDDPRMRAFAAKEDGLADARRDLLAAAEELADVVSLQRGRLDDVKRLDPAFDDRGEAARLAATQTKLERMLAENAEPISAADASALAAEAQAHFGDSELDVLAEISSPSAMRKASQRREDPQLRKDRAYQAKRVLVETHRAHDRAKVDTSGAIRLDRQAQYDARLHSSLSKAGMASEFEHRAMSAGLNGVRALKASMRDSGVDAYATDESVDLMWKLDRAVERQTYHRLREALDERQAVVEETIAKIRAEATSLAAQPDTPMNRARAELLDSRLTGLARSLGAIGAERGMLANSALATSVLALHDDDAQDPPALETLERETRAAFKAVKAAGTRKSASGAASKDDARKVRAAFDHAEALIDGVQDDLPREGGGRFSVSRAEIDAVFAHWGSEVDAETEARRRARDEPGPAARMWADAKAGIASLFGRHLSKTKTGIGSVSDAFKGAASVAEGLKSAPEAYDFFRKWAEDGADGAAASVDGADGGADVHAEHGVDGTDAAGGDGDGEHGGFSSRMERLAFKLGVVEHAVSAVGSVMGVVVKQRDIDATEARQARGRDLIADFDKRRYGIADPVKRARYETRHRIAHHFGEALKAQNLSACVAARVEQTAGVGHAARHVAQGTGYGLQLAKSAAAATAGALMSNVGAVAAFFFESAEFLVACHELQEAREHAETVEKGIEKETHRVAAKHRTITGGGSAGFQEMQSKLATYETDPTHDGDAAEALRADLRDLAKLRSFADVLNDGNDLSAKRHDRAELFLGAVGYGAMAVSIGLAPLTGGATILVGAAASGAASGVKMIVKGHGVYGAYKRTDAAQGAERALKGFATPGTVEKLRDQAEAKGVSVETLAWDLATRQDPSRRASQLYSDLLAETSGDRLSDEDIARRARLTAKASHSIVDWQRKTKRLERAQAEANKLADPRRAKVGDAGDRFAEVKRAADAAQREVDAAFHEVQAARKAVFDFEARRDHLFNPASAKRSTTAMQLMFAGLSKADILAMIDAGEHENDPAAQALCEDFILHRLTGE